MNVNGYFLTVLDVMFYEEVLECCICAFNETFIGCFGHVKNMETIRHEHTSKK